LALHAVENLRETLIKRVRKDSSMDMKKKTIRLPACGDCPEVLLREGDRRSCEAENQGSIRFMFEIPYPCLRESKVKNGLRYIQKKTYPIAGNNYPDDVIYS
jgi:hypothetical protein